MTKTLARNGDILALEDPRTADPAVAGGKAASLGELRRAGFPVPPGLVIPAGGRDFENELLDRYAALGPDAPVAVRSSGPREDGAETSRAGRYETFLDVTGVRDLLAAVYRCRRSGDGEELAVLVMPMVPAAVSGVAFSADPVTGDPERIRVAAAPGAGGVVDGEAGEEVVLDAATGEVVERRAAGERLLSDADLDEILRLALTLDARRGRPQDLEWARAGGRIHLLQARPITALPEHRPAPPGGREYRLAFAGRFSRFGRSLEAVKREVYNEAIRRHTGRDAEYAGHEHRGWIFERLRWRRRPIREALFLLRALLPGAAPMRAFRRGVVPAYLGKVRRFEAAATRARNVPAAVRHLADLVRLYLDFQGKTLRVALGVERYPLIFRRVAALLCPELDADALLLTTATVTRRRDLLLSAPELTRNPGVLREVGYLLVPGNPKDPGRAGLAPPVPGSRPPAPPAGPKAREATAGPVRSALLRRLLRLAREHHSFREEKNHLFYRGVWGIRHALRRLGELLRAEGILEEVADAALLDLGEATRVPEDWAAHFRAVARAMPFRRAEETRAARYRPPTTLRPGRAEERDAGRCDLSGKPGAPGTGEGPVRFVRGAEDFAAFRDGDVLVCPRLRPFFSPLLPRAAGLVAEEGTALSHAATLAREYGVPAVVGVAGALQSLREGERIRVYGEAGTVERRAERPSRRPGSSREPGYRWAQERGGVRQ